MHVVKELISLSMVHIDLVVLWRDQKRMEGSRALQLMRHGVEMMMMMACRDLELLYLTADERDRVISIKMDRLACLWRRRLAGLEAVLVHDPVRLVAVGGTAAVVDERLPHADEA
uniref:Uncharacterized protein n=1 Tax=Oryza brachyantha TaxID=4533 RepID=J3MAI8_ORYBR